ncbi:MAG: hypothetical protein IKZ60_04785 [Bacteroidales bacterium]|nr:hypothetical protein [Bacteroidales bacterium]
MKKYFIIAVAALAASAACSKVETVDTTPDKKIAFEVANYTAQTKADTLSLTNAEDGIYQFHTFAYQFPTIGNPREFMNDDIFAWQDAAQTNKLTSGSSPVKVWATEMDYYWPKTGYINFYSYAGTHTPAETVNDTADWKTVTFTYTDAVIDSTSNILVADAALHQGRANSAANAFDVDNDGNGADVTAGVPTLFHHQLAKIIFDVEARTTEAKKSANTVWKVQVLGTHTYNDGTGDVTIKSNIFPINKGTLALSNTDDATGASTKAWIRTNEDTTNISGWVPTTEKETIQFYTSDTLTIAVNTTGNGVRDTVLAARSVMPQLTNGVKFTLVYMVQALHGSTVYLEEIRTVGIDADKVLSDLAGTVTSWGANKKITYHIIIDPVSEKVTFDPAVEDYDSIDADGNQDIININENGIVNP